MLASWTSMGRSIRTFSARFAKWPKINGSVIIPYTLSSSYESFDRNIILKAFRDLQASTCLRFVERTTERDYIAIEPAIGCFSSVGRVGGMQLVSLAFECLRTDKGKGIALHELMHVAGFWHEHSRADRDDYIWIIWDEILIGYEKNFCKYATTNMLVKYELQSILHYPRSAFSKSGQATINPKYPYSKIEIGQREKLSASDILRVNKLYSCSQYTSSDDDDDELNYFPPIVYSCNKELKPTSTKSYIEHKNGALLMETPAQMANTKQTSVLSQTAAPTVSFQRSSVNEGTAIAGHKHTTLLSSVNMTGDFQDSVSTGFYQTSSETNSSQSLNEQLQETLQKSTMRSNEGLFTSAPTTLPSHVINLSSLNAFSTLVNLSVLPTTTVTPEPIKIPSNSNFSQIVTNIMQKTQPSVSTLASNSISPNTVELTHNALIPTKISRHQHRTDETSTVPEQVTLLHVNESTEHGTPTESNQILTENVSSKPTPYPPEHLDYSNLTKSEGENLNYVINSSDTSTTSINLVSESISSRAPLKSTITTAVSSVEIPRMKETGSPSLSMTLMYNKMKESISVATYSSPNGISTSTLSPNTVRGEQNRSMQTALGDLSGNSSPGPSQGAAYEQHNYQRPKYHIFGKRSLNEPLPTIKSISPLVSDIKREAKPPNSHIHHNKFNTRRHGGTQQHRAKLQLMYSVKNPMATFLNGVEGFSLSRNPWMSVGQSTVNSHLASVEDAEDAQSRKLLPSLSPLHNRHLTSRTKISRQQQACKSDHEFCGWKQRKDNKLIWNLIWGGTDHLHGGRTSKDKRKGLLLSLKNFSMEPTQGQKALLVSPVLHRPNCVSFWYRLLPNSTVGTLNVYSRPTNMLGTQTLLWTNQGQENLGWTKAQITFKKQHQHNNLQIIIKGVTGPESDIRIKNLYVGQCG
ncbi:astacin-like metalloendopeptidase isoform X2 [Xenopus tropicalis]|uniref:Metalloendopeptidase n=1 Tax=Xenopus tropicalis TaxID=8364 RepID=A0A803K5M3_XENTR|nr:astacin-like metalloendopeptidase isoform X2 [Xenopus tropicalis]